GDEKPCDDKPADDKPADAKKVDTAKPAESKPATPPAAQGGNRPRGPAPNTNNSDASKNQARRRKLVRDLEVIIHEFPEDLEAKPFLAKHICLTSSAGLPITSHEAVSALIDQVLAKEPLHPVHHYKIHLWDAEHGDWALGSAARCGQSGPNVAHMW